MDPVVARLTRFFTQLISETSGLSLEDTLALAQQSPLTESDPDLARCIDEFRDLPGSVRLHDTPIEKLFEHPISHALADFFRRFPIPFHDEHIHLTGSLDADFVYPRLAPLLEQPVYQAKIRQVYGEETSIRSAADVD